MEFFVDVYYFFGLLFGVINLYYVFNSESLLSQDFDPKSPKSLGSFLLSSIFIRIPYILWVVVGLITYQWKIFLGLVLSTLIFFLLHSLFNNVYLKIFLTKVSTFIECVLVFFISLNYFHFGIKLSSFFV